VKATCCQNRSKTLEPPGLELPMSAEPHTFERGRLILLLNLLNRLDATASLRTPKSCRECTSPLPIVTEQNPAHAQRSSEFQIWGAVRTARSLPDPNESFPDEPI